MADQDNGDDGRWDVGATDGVVLVERRGADDKRMFTDRLEPDDARRLAELLSKFADKAETAEARDDESEDDDSDESEDDDSDESDDNAAKDGAAKDDAEDD